MELLSTLQSDIFQEEHYRRNATEERTNTTEERANTNNHRTNTTEEHVFDKDL